MSSSVDAPAPRALPKKEAEIFRTLVKFCETKQYKKGIKSAETILKKIPNHGETQAMKALCLLNTGEKLEAYEYIKKGIRNDIRSYICWHCYGLMHRQDQNYKEAVKCFLNALKIDTDNPQILRDLSWLQVQIRDLDGFVETRRQLLHIKPTVRQNWVAYAAANFLAGHYETGFHVVEKYNETVTERDSDYGESELLLFQNMCIEKQGKFDDAITHIQSHKAAIVDKLAMRTKHAELLVKDGRFEEARQLWTGLVTEQPDNYRLLSGMQTAYLELSPDVSAEMYSLKALELPSTTLELSQTQRKVLLEVHSHAKFRSRSAVIIAVSLQDGPAFREALDGFLRKNLTDTVPSLYADVCSLIRKVDDSKPGRQVLVSDTLEFRSHPITIMVLDLLDHYITNLRASSTFTETVTEGMTLEPPTTILWSLFLKAHMLEKSGLLLDALAIIDECLGHTPTALDMHIKKARIVRKLGDPLSASQLVDSCRALDLQDRYLNNKTTKYLLRADNVPQAMDTIAMFTRHDGDPQHTLFYLQCSWYELELADSYARQKNYGLALKKYYDVHKHFIQYFEDQFDFHGFCMRKTTVRAYLETVKMCDSLFAHKFYQRAFRGAVRVYLSIMDNPVVDQSNLDDFDLSHLSPAERKKEKERRRKLKKKEAETEVVKAVEEKKPLAKVGDVEAPKDDDPKGEKLMALPPLEEASKWCLRLQLIPTCDVESRALIAEVMLRRNKFVSALRNISVGLRDQPRNPDLTVALIKFALKFDSNKSPNAVVNGVVQTELAKLLEGNDPIAFVMRFVEESIELGLHHRNAAAKCLVELVSREIGNKADMYARAVALLADDGIWSKRGIELNSVIETYRLLNDVFLSEESSQRLKSKILEKFPYSRYFQSQYEIIPLDRIIACPGSDPGAAAEHSA